MLYRVKYDVGDIPALIILTQDQVLDIQPVLGVFWHNGYLLPLDCVQEINYMDVFDVL
jgi:hypothetical protein